MRQERIVDALNLLEDDILEETDALRRHGRTAAVRWRWMGAVIAACLVMACSWWIFYQNRNMDGEGGTFISGYPSDAGSVELSDGNGENSPLKDETEGQPPSSVFPSGSDSMEIADSNGESTPAMEEVDGLPLLSVMDFSATGAAGFGAEMAYDVSELVSGNPWGESDYFSTLPVYQNPISIDVRNNFKVTGMDIEKMWEVLQDMIDRLGLDNASLEMAGPSISIDSSEPIAIEEAVVSAKGDGIELEVDAFLMVHVIFDPPVTLPDNYNNDFYASYEEKAALGEYLQDAFSSLIGWDEPTLLVTGGGYSFNGNQSYEVEFYNGEGNLMEKILNYNFHRIEFYSDSYGNQLNRIRIIQPDCSQKLGDYPIITAQKARELLLEGKYVTSVPYEVPGEEYVASVELLYSTGVMDEYFMPYYRFYVELPEERNANKEAQERGLLTYGIYYVPAVEEKYLDGKELWHFNF